MMYRPLRWLAVAALSAKSYALHRTVGDPDDPIMQGVASECLADPRNGFGYGKCPDLMRCVLDTLTSERTTGMQSGSNIASLVPTTLALIGVSPLNIIQLAFISPLRGMVVCVFGIGLPQGLFRQLSAFPSTQTQNHDDDDDDGDTRTSQSRTRRWVVPIPTTLSIKEHELLWWRRTIRAIFIDMLFLGLLAVMLWQNSSLGLQTMVTWRCDYSFLLICWPIACVLWLLIAMSGLLILAKNIRIQYSDDSNRVECSWTELVKHTYRLPRTKYEEAMMLDATTNISHGPLKARDQAFYIDITMRFDRAWEYYEAGIETLAVGIYLYATFVLTSSVFVSGETGITYMTVMVVCLSLIRVLASIG